MALTPKIKKIQVTADVTIQQIADALGCNGAMCMLDNVNYGILTMEDMITIPVVIPPNAGFAIAGIGTDTWTLYKIVNGNVETTENIKTIKNYMSYVVSDNYILFSSGNTNAYFGYGFFKGKDMIESDTPEMWEYYTQYSGSTATTNIYLWDRNSTNYNGVSNLVALTNDANLVITSPLYNHTTGWLSDGDVYFAIERPSSFNTSGKTYTFSMNQAEYLILTCLGSMSSAKSLICFNTSSIPNPS